MRLDFTILWIDDQQRHIASFSDGLKFKLLDQGFELRVTPIAKVADVDPIVAEHVHDDLIDLVMVDYDLGQSGRSGGEEVLRKIRDKFPFKEVIFYSATDRDSLRQIAFNAKVDGVHFSTRLSLVDDAMHVIKKLLSKVVDIDHMRGIVMSASSDIDYMIENSLTAVYTRLTAEQQATFRTKLTNQIEKKISSWQGDLKKAANKNELASFLKLKSLFTSYDKLTCLLNQLDEGGWATGPHNHHLEKLKEYQNNIVPKRNKLAHAMLKREPGKRPELIGPQGLWGVQEMTELRRSYLEHRENFQTIATLVDASLE